MCKVITVSNQKGGTAKTTTSFAAVVPRVHSIMLSWPFDSLY